MLRVLLKQILTALTKWAIKKHDIKIIAILGEKQSRLTSYILWELLREEYFTRSQWDKSFWDLSIPLTILGYDSTRKHFFGWTSTIVKASWVLLTQKSTSQIIVLHIPYSLPEILQYWFDLFDPAVVLAFENDLNPERLDVIKNNIDTKKSKFLVVSKDIKKDWLAKKGIKYDLPGVFWDLPVLGAAFVADLYGVSSKEINKSLDSLEPLTFLKVREKIND